MEENKLTMQPGDYWVSSFGLKVENISPDMVIEVAMPIRAKKYPLQIVQKHTKEEKITPNH